MAKQEQTVTVHVVAYRKAPGLHVQAAVTPELLDLTDVAGGVTIQPWASAYQATARPS
jgi:hypothetical protein